MQTPTIFLIFVMISFFIRHLIRKSKTMDISGYLEEDIKAMSIKAKDIDENLFIKPNMESLPFQPELDPERYKRILRSERFVLEKSKPKMIKLNKKFSNLELKQQFGHSNLEMIAIYEENFSQYIWALVRWASVLLEENMTSEAILVLKHSIELGSESSKVYIMLASIYHTRQDTASIKGLLENIKNKDFESKQSIVEHLEKLF